MLQLFKQVNSIYEINAAVFNRQKRTRTNNQTIISTKKGSLKFRLPFSFFLYFSPLIKRVDKQFYNSIVNSTAHRPIRDLLSGQVLNNPILLPDLLEIAFDTEDKNHHKACWTLELVLQVKIEWLSDHIDDFCNALPNFKQDGAVRSISKICMFAAQHNQKKPGFLNGNHLQQTMEACFDWLIDEKVKVATKAYAMRALFILGKKEDWVYPELSRILAEDSMKHSFAYIAAAKDILKRIKRHDFIQDL